LDLLSAVLGLGMLLAAGDVLVRGAVSLSLRLGVPALIVSLTVVSFGTSAPELLISVRAVLDHVPGIALGNVVGSNTANVLLVLGLPAMFYGLQLGRCDTRRSYVFMLGASVWFIALAFLGPMFWVHGLLLLILLTVVLADQVRAARAHRRAAQALEVELEAADPHMPWWKIVLFLALGLAGLPLGAGLLVDAAVNIATDLGISETAIGLTLVAVGTSLPELATTMVAAYRGRAEVALGNAIGSNMFNLLGIIGVAGLFGRIPVDPAFLRLDLWVMLGASLVLAPFVLRGRNITRVAGAVLVGLYLLYMLSILH